VKDVADFFKAYLKGQFVLSFVLGVFYALGFGLCALPWGYAIGFITGFLSWVPLVGSLIGFLGALVVVSIYFSWPLLIKVTLVYIFGQLLEAFVLAPKILGKSVGLGFWSSLGAVLIGMFLLGPLGAIVAVPVAGLLKFLMAKKALEQKALAEPQKPQN